MEVTLIFDPVFQGETTRAVWIVDTATNTEWFAGQRDLDPNSAIFSIDHYPTVEAAVTQMVWNAQEHHPAWEQIKVVGAALTPVVSANLQEEGLISSTPTGFILRRF